MRRVRPSSFTLHGVAEAFCSSLSSPFLLLRRRLVLVPIDENGSILGSLPDCPILFPVSIEGRPRRQPRRQPSRAIVLFPKLHQRRGDSREHVIPATGLLLTLFSDVRSAGSGTTMPCICNLALLQGAREGLRLDLDLLLTKLTSFSCRLDCL